MKYLITPNPTYNPEHVGQLLNTVGVGPMLVHGDRSVTVVLTDQQKDDFIRRGGSAHLMQAMPDPVATATAPTPPGEPAPPPGPPPEPPAEPAPPPEHHAKQHHEEPHRGVKRFPRSEE